MVLSGVSFVSLRLHRRYQGGHAQRQAGPGGDVDVGGGQEEVVRRDGHDVGVVATLDRSRKEDRDAISSPPPGEKSR